MGPINLWQLLTGGNGVPPEAMGPHPIDGEQFPGTMVPGAPKRYQQQIPPPQPTTVTPEMGTVPAGPVEPPYRGPASMPGKPAAGVPAGVMATGANNPAREEIARLLEMQEAEVDRQRELYDQAAGMEAQQDLRPIAAFVDSMTGGHSAAAAAPSFTQADKLKLMSQLRENVAQGQEKLTSAKLRQALGEEGLDMRQLAMIMSGNRKVDSDNQKSERVQQRIGEFSANFFNKMKQSAMYKKLEEQGTSFDQLDELMDAADAGNATAFNSIGTKMAKAMGEVGVLTDKDVTRYVKSQKLDRAFSDRASLWLKGTPSAATMGDLRHIAKILRIHAGNKIKALGSEYTRVLSRNFDMSEKEARERLGMPGFALEEVPAETRDSGGTSAAAPVKPAASGKGRSVKDIDDEMARLKAEIGGN